MSFYHLWVVTIEYIEYKVQGQFQLTLTCKIMTEGCGFISISAWWLIYYEVKGDMLFCRKNMGIKPERKI